MKITMTGTGYVGLVTGACLAEVGNDVLCLDLDRGKIELLNRGGVPIHEPGLPEIIHRNVTAQRLHFTTDVDAAVRHGTMQFIAVGTPPDEDGSADMTHVIAAARAIGERMTDYKVVVDKSTVPVGTADRVRETIAAELARRGAQVPFAVVSNPEFLKEGAAIDDFMRPDRVVIGADDERAIMLLRAVYAPFQRNHERLLVMDVRSAELTKYAANAMLATRISFMNELANLAEALGADIEDVRRGIGADPRIGYHFLYPGAGYGGSCFPKDVRALQFTARQHEQPLRILAAVEAVNEAQKSRLVEKVTGRLGTDLTDRRIAVWGLAFKPNTDDMREAPARTVVSGLVERGAAVVAYDPVAMNDAKRAFAALPRVTFVDSPLAAAADADALVVITEWQEFRSPDFAELRRRLRQPLVFDGRNLYDPALVRAAGLEYFGIGRP
ncbi:MAG TPA: UDP-glucose/GDP-mannose dehydrogenase family protein [Casimicrobiaceae bacterium]|nr:UDP-glucose/GDP-mannose dehydrogenase family protein [Casimicrobiaceae bacterium]